MSAVENSLVSAMDDTCMVNNTLYGRVVQFYTTTGSRQKGGMLIFFFFLSTSLSTSDDSDHCFCLLEV